MARKESQEGKPFRRPRVSVSIGDALLYSFDIGTGECKGFSSEFLEIIRFAPILSPISEKKTIKSEETKPTYSLRSEGGHIDVFGVDDVFQHGKWALRRRLSGGERYLDSDYYKLFKVMLMHAFKRFIGTPDYIRPSGVVSVPVYVYNDEEKMLELVEGLCGKHEITDFDGCILRIEIVRSKLLIIPEGYGANQHRVYEAATLQKRDGTNTAGSVILIDAGYETINQELYERMTYIKDKAYTLQRAGLGVVVRSIAEWAAKELRGVDVSRIDQGLRAVAGMPLGAEKMVEVAPGVTIDVQPVYDPEIISLSKRISDEVLTNYPDSANHVAISGGTAYHVYKYVGMNLNPLPLKVVPDADVANPLGALTKLYREVSKRQGA